MGPRSRAPGLGAEASWNTGMGGGAPPSPPSPTRARDTTTPCKQKRLPQPPGGGGCPGWQPVGQWAKAGASPAHMPSPEARDGEGAPPRGGQETRQQEGCLELKHQPPPSPLYPSPSLSSPQPLCSLPGTLTSKQGTHVGPSQAAELVLQVAGEVVGLLDGGPRPWVPCAIESWHRRKVPEHSTQASQHPPRVPCGQTGKAHEAGPGRSGEAAGRPSGVCPHLGLGRGG